eukprot:m.351513 g.351513  ORF g.351513 m.351513 type:complete len:58 (-) comp16266_c0_seq1:343-516(-)
MKLYTLIMVAHDKQLNVPRDTSLRKRLLQGQMWDGLQTAVNSAPRPRAFVSQDVVTK